MKKGFTLIELLVLIAIIGILTSIILASIHDSEKKYIVRDSRGNPYRVNKVVEQDGCVILNQDGHEVKICGNYSIIKQ